MAYTKTISTTATPNFLESEVGLVLKTRQVDNVGIDADDFGNKTVVAGTIYPTNDGNAEGIIFEDVDVTNGEHAAPVLVAGRVLASRLPVAPSDAAKTALAAKGIILVTETDVPVLASAISLNKTTLSISVGASETLVATVLPFNAADRTVTWTSSNTSKATVDENGVVTGKASGSATITATNTTTNTVTATCTVTVS